MTSWLPARGMPCHVGSPQALASSSMLSLCMWMQASTSHPLHVDAGWMSTVPAATHYLHCDSRARGAGRKWHSTESAPIALQCGTAVTGLWICFGFTSHESFPAQSMDHTSWEGE